MRVYRIIEFDGTAAEIEKQLCKSLTDGHYILSRELEMRIKTRKDNPCEQGFIDNVPYRQALIPKEVYNKLEQGTNNVEQENNIPKTQKETQSRTETN